MKIRWPSFVIALVLLHADSSLGISAPQRNFTDVVEWYDSLGYPDATNLPYVRVATGLTMQSGNEPPENQFVDADIANLPEGAGGAAIERLLLAALDDTEQRLGMKGTYNEASYEDPRICDMAALVLSMRWPGKYAFNWSPSAAERDAQIAVAKRK
jgi:hypothetical protein